MIDRLAQLNEWTTTGVLPFRPLVERNESFSRRPDSSEKTISGPFSLAFFWLFDVLSGSSLPLA